MAVDVQDLRYKQVAYKIGKALSPEEIHDLKFLCKDIPGFSQADVDEISDGLALITKLEQLDVLTKEKVDLVVNFLSLVNRKDLEGDLKQYEQEFITRSLAGQVGGPVTQPMSAQFQQNNGYQSAAFNSQNQPAAMGEDLSTEFDIIVENIGRDWRQLARRLGLTEVDIECITENHSRNLREQSRQALWMWKNKHRREATRQALIATLRKCKMNYIADIVEGYINP
ncbi:FAS-associated death domain protein-like [Lytechinus variegatus]|uniref:FAS-associated death domain protein-like n=1 Tax=Lytechinus variegatus TaxID=7654 RepID=UPI001BB27C68|nr:FAS-associated death domain protein-like [Lytechinus variegatus]